MDDPKKGSETKGSTKVVAHTAEKDGSTTEVPKQEAPATVNAIPAATTSTLTPAQQQHLRSHLGEDALVARIFHSEMPVPCKPLSIVLQNVRANSKVFVAIRDDQSAVWSEGDGEGLVGLSFSTTRDQALYLSNFLINAREFYLQTYSESQEIVMQLYVRTGQNDLRGRVDLPPGAIATFQSRTDRTSVVGLSAFAVDF